MYINNAMSCITNDVINSLCMSVSRCIPVRRHILTQNHSLWRSFLRESISENVSYREKHCELLYKHDCTHNRISRSARELVGFVLCNRGTLMKKTVPPPPTPSPEYSRPNYNLVHTFDHSRWGRNVGLKIVDRTNTEVGQRKTKS